VLFAEITRMLNHLLNLTTFALDVGAITPLLWGFEEREKLMEFYERVRPARGCTPTISARAAYQDLPAGLADRTSPPGSSNSRRIDDDLERC
jgi:NADH-quinone oxidoreductase subunit D